MKLDGCWTASTGVSTLPTNAEITMEANPGTVECGIPAGYRDAGVNRLSFWRPELQRCAAGRIGRIHRVDDIVRAVNEARAAGFDNINIDLMHGLPGQGVAAAIEDLEAAIALEPAHISWYQLTLEPNTVFHARPPRGPAGRRHRRTKSRTTGRRCWPKAVTASTKSRRSRATAAVLRHNLNYWLFGDYLAAGAGAHGKISDRHGVFRYQKPANPLQYMETIEAREPAARCDAGRRAKTWFSSSC